MWIKCEDRLPDTPKKWLEWVTDKKSYVVAYKAGSGYCYQTMDWCDGWNCSLTPDDTISKEHEITNIVAWFEIPEYKG